MLQYEDRIGVPERVRPDPLAEVALRELVDYVTTGSLAPLGRGAVSHRDTEPGNIPGS